MPPHQQISGMMMRAERFSISSRNAKRVISRSLRHNGRRVVAASSR